jgi:two-component system phosphate regulon sensor histidine kinase PhoR
MEAGRIKLNLEEVSLSAIAHGVATKLAPLAEEGHLTLYMDFPNNLPSIDGDRVRLEQVLTNLVENAIKFTPPQGEITIGARPNGGTMRLTVHDTGIGIPLEEQEKVFDRFYQVDWGEKRAYRGTGLGLAISRHIVERHSGTIWVESDGIAGHGSSFHVELPLELRLAEAPTIDFSTPRRKADTSPAKEKRVVL